VQREIAALTRRLADDTERMADYSFDVMLLGGLVGLLQIGLLLRQHSILDRQTHIIQTQLFTNQTVERAYISVTHNRPGLEFTGWVTQWEGEPPREEVWVRLKVANRGNTPAIVTRHLFQLYVSREGLPIQPPYNETYAANVRVSLVSDESFTHPVSLRLPPETHAQLQAEQTDAHGLRAYVLGCVDYTDKFGVRHRAGYARVFSPVEDTELPFTDKAGKLDRAAYATRNNLVFVMQKDYNYDRLRQPGEGNDWNDPAPTTGVNS
jgi:hypothetical protein